MTGLIDHIRNIIREKGPISVAYYMELALQHPVYGYYKRHDPLGVGGDFITAPEISQMFGEMIGLWCAEVWRAMGSPEKFILLELGSGRGTLLQDALRATSKINNFHKSLRLFMLESNETLCAMQKEKLREFNPVYLDDIGDLPEEPTIVIANEFFDAMPIYQMVQPSANDLDAWSERKIGMDGDNLVFVNIPSIPCAENEKVIIREFSPVSSVLVHFLAEHVAKNGGAGLIIDYGYVSPSGFSTLQAVSGHRRAEVLENPGEVDLTAHVDFAAIGKEALSAGAQVLGPTGQGEFLRAMGIEIRAEILQRQALPLEAEEITSALSRLTDETQMGELFKAICFADPSLRGIPGF